MTYFLLIILATILSTTFVQPDANESKSKLAENNVNKLNGTPPQQRSSLTVGSSDIDSLNKAAKHLQAVVVQTARPNSRVKQNADGASVRGKLVPLAASASLSNFENRGVSDKLKKNLNGKSQAVHFEKNDSVIFPPAVGVNTRTSFGFNEETLIPTSDEIESCQLNSFAGASLCNLTSKYPSSFIRNILNKRGLFSPLFGNDLLSPEIKADVIGTRFQADQGFKTLCASKQIRGEVDEGVINNLLNYSYSQEFLHYPRLGKTVSNEWKYIIQSDDESQRFVQGIRVEVCINQHQKCDLVDNVPIGYELQCVQKYIYRRLLAISPNDKAAIPDNFELPSCCVCVYKTSSESELRSNFGPEKTPLVASKPALSKPSSSKPCHSKATANC